MFPLLCFVPAVLASLFKSKSRPQKLYDEEALQQVFARARGFIVRGIESAGLQSCGIGVHFHPISRKTGGHLRFLCAASPAERAHARERNNMAVNNILFLG
jgi:hypothetical protein